MLASRAGVDAPALLFGFRVDRARHKEYGESGQVNGWRTPCARRRDSVVSPEPLGETGEGLQRHGRVDVHGCCLRPVADDGGWRVLMGDGGLWRISTGWSGHS